ncbi:MAG: hypothetical protein Q9190_001877 [Brigantiaea leucoxantha]
MSTINPPKALFFDALFQIFGTVVDWRTTVSQTLSAQAAYSLNSSTASIPASVRLFAATISWPDFAQQWRDTYKDFTFAHSKPLSSNKGKRLSSSSGFHESFGNGTNNGNGAFKNVDQHHYDSLVQLLADHHLSGLWTTTETRAISQIWHFLDPQPDSPPALHALGACYPIYTLSNGNVSLLRDLSLHADLPWTRILSSEHFGAYKPNPGVYLGAAEVLGLRPDQCAMVASHLGDLSAASRVGMQTVYVERLDEEDWNEDEVRGARAEGWVDMWIGAEERGLLEVARRLGAGNGGWGGKGY